MHGAPLMSGMPATPEADLAGALLQELDTPWQTVVWNDPVNLMSYVTYVFRSYFGYSRERAEELMLEVHERGHSVVSTGGREEMERDTEAMHSFGLWATCRRGER